MRVTAVALLGLALVPLAGAAPTGLAVVGATLIDGTDRPPVADSVVVIEGERIKAVGPRATTPIPKGAEILDGRGAYVVPGLIDAHVHFFQSGGVYTRPDIIDLQKLRSYADEQAAIRRSLPGTFARYLLSGVTSVADVGGPFWNFEVRDLANRTALAPRVAAAGPLVSTISRPQLDLGDPPIVQTAGPEEARQLVRREAQRRPDLLKVWFVYRPGDDVEVGRALVQATVEEGRAFGLRTAVHAMELETARAAVQAGAAVLVHSVADKPVDDAFVALVKEKRVLYVPTLFVREGYDLALSGRWTPTPAEVRWGDPAVMATFEELKAHPELFRKARARERPEPANLKRLSDAGALVAAGTDAGNIGTLHGPSLHRELRLMAEAGLTPARVLVAATRNGAAVMGRERDLGTLEVGKLADLLVLDKDPLPDVANLESIRHVVKGGRLFGADELKKAAALEAPGR